MCYSALIRSDYRKFVRLFGATMSLREFADLFTRRAALGPTKVKIPKLMELLFSDPQTPEEVEIKALIDAFHVEQASKLEQEVFKQRKRLNDAERKLQVKSTKAALEDQRIATDKIEKAKADLQDLHRTEAVERDGRIFPLTYAPVMVMQEGKRVVMPMRYQCRPAGKPAVYDIKYPGTYNARRDNLEGFWKGQFGYAHGVMLASAFYENVNRHRMEQRELEPDEKVQNVVLEFRPNNAQDMLVACLWSRWRAEGEPDLLSFAAITDEPPSEVAAAGHDRCIIPIRPENVDAWLNPDPKNLKALYDILDDRERPYYEHLLLAA
jgi:putative SOS response-associated peptidase YedK